MTEPRLIATFNLGNLARVGAEVYETPPRTDAEYEEKSAFLRRMFEAMQADVVGVQEIFHREALVQACAGVYSEDQIHTPLPPGVPEPEARSPRVGLLCRPPLAAPARVHRNLPTPQTVLGLELVEFRRPILEAELWLWPEVRVTVFVVHFKSPRPLFLAEEDEADPAGLAVAMARAHAVRFAEAAQLKVLAMQAALRGPVVVLGDFNSKAHDPAIDVLRGRRAPPGAGQQVSARFESARLHDARSLARRGGGVAFGETFVYAGRAEVVDHVLLSGAFAPFVEPPVAQVMRVRTLSDHLGEDGHALARTASDHAPVLVLLQRGH